MDKAARTRWLTRGASLAFAIFLWFFVTWDKTTLTTRDITVPLTYQDITEGYLISNIVQNVEVRLEGRLENFALMSVSDITASVGMEDLRPGKYRLPIQIASPRGTSVVSYSPNVVDFELFRIIERRLRPYLVLDDKLPDNLSMSSVDIVPSEVTVKGPEASVMAVRRAEVHSFVHEATGGERELPVVLVNESGEVKDLTVDPVNVLVNAHFTRTLQEAKVPVTLDVTGVPGDGLEIGSITVSPDMVTLRGTRDALLGVAAITINPIDVSGHTESMNVDIPLDPPSDAINIVGADHVNLRIEFRNAVQMRTYLGVPIALHGVSNVKNWTVSPPLASVTVERPGMAGSALDPDHPPFELYVDATNVVASQLVLPILLRNVENGVNVTRIEPQQATITFINQ
jgi:YbbR domain-containing protein